MATDNANTAYRQLFDRKFQDERIFFIPGSAWSQSLPAGQTKPDNDVGQAPNYSQGLEKGENNFAYVSGLTNESKGNLPIVANGFSDHIGAYNADPKRRGGVFDGEIAVVVRVDGSGRMEKLDRRDLRVYEKRAGKKVDIFSSEYLAPGTIVLNPN